MADRRLIRWGGLAAIGGGVLFVAQGTFMMARNYNLDALPLALLLFSVGLVGLRARLPESPGLLSRIGGILAYLALVASITEFTSLLLMAWQEDIFWPIHGLGLAAGLFAVILASGLLGIAAYRSRTVPERWREVLLAMCVLWVPLWLLGEWVGDQTSPGRELSLGFVPAGFAWMLLGYAIGFVSGERPADDSATPAQPTLQPSYSGFQGN